MDMPSIRRLAPNFTQVNIASVSVWFSYETPIAFAYGGQTVVCHNIWSSTTGRHLNKIDGGKKINRVSIEKFYELYRNAVAQPSGL